MTNEPKSFQDHPILFFDGVCNLCNRSVQFVLLRDRRGLFRFAPLQSALAEELLGKRGVDLAKLDSVVLLQGDRVFERSAAVVEVLKLLGGGWRLVGALLGSLPVRLRDVVYDFVARKRYGWFGKRDKCMVPRPEWRERFLG